MLRWLSGSAIRTTTNAERRFNITPDICDNLLNLAIDFQVRLITVTYGSLGGVGNQLQGSQISTEQAERGAPAREA